VFVILQCTRKGGYGLQNNTGANMQVIVKRHKGNKKKWENNIKKQYVHNCTVTKQRRQQKQKRGKFTTI
jgi:hypothetical protein